MDRGFPNIFWVRTPSGQELEHFDADPNKRSMMCWYSTVLPCLRALHDQEGSNEAFVLEDTFVCDVDVTFETIHRETRHRGAGVLATQDTNKTEMEIQHGVGAKDFISRTHGGKI